MRAALLIAWTAICLAFGLGAAPWERVLAELAGPAAAAAAPLGLSALLLGLGSVLAMSAAIWLVGEAALRLSGFGPADWRRSPLAYGAGLLVHSWALTALAAAGWMTPGAVRALLLAGAAAGAATLARDRQAARLDPRPGLARLALADRLGWGAVAALLLGPALLAALSPPLFYDALACRLGIPDQFLKAGGFFRHHANFYGSFPLGWDMLNALGLAFGSPAAAKTVHWGAYAGLAAALARAGGASGWPAALLLLSMPGLLQHLDAAGIELGAAFFLLLAWDCLSEEKPDGRRDLLGCAFAGGLLASKYVMALPWAATGLAFAWRRRSPRFLALYAAAGALLFAPWGIKNLVYHGNPVYPLLDAALGPKLAATSSALARADWLSLGLPRNLLSPWAPFSGTTTDWDFFGLAALWALPLLWPRRRSPAARLAAGTALACWLGWGLSSRLARYLLPAQALWLLAFARALREERPEPALGACAAALALAHALVGGYFVARTGSWRAALSGEPLVERLSRSAHGYFNPYAPILAWPGATAIEGKVLLLGEARTAYLPFRAEAASWYEPQPIVGWARGAASAEDLRERLRREGITHLLLNLPEAMRFQRETRAFPWDETSRRAFSEFWDRFVALEAAAVRRDKDPFAVYLYKLRATPRPQGERPPENLVLGFERFLGGGSY